MPLIDENFQRLARMQNLFGPANPIGTVNSNPFNGGGRGVSLSDNMPGFPYIMNEAGNNPNPPEPQYQPDTRASDMLFQMIQNMPQRNNPGIGRKILASISGLGGGPQMAEHALYAPYINQMQDWQAKLGPVEKIAAEERMQNANMRQLYASMLRDQSTQRGLDIKEADQARKEKGTDAYIKFKQYQMDHPKEEMLAPKGGNYQFRNPDTHQIVDTGVSTGTMDPLQELEFKRETAIKTAEILAGSRTGIESMQQSGATAREAETYSITDPNDPNKTILVAANPVTGKAQRIKLGEQDITGATKPGTPRAGATAGQPANLAAIRDIAQQTLDALDNVVDEKGKLRPDTSAAVGRSYFAGYIPTTEAYTGAGKIKQLKDLMTLNLIGEIKKQSRTGATGFGNMQLRELGLLENAASRINPKMNETDFEQAVKDAREKIMKILQDPDGGVMRKQQRNTKTGETRTVESSDGGKTWKPVAAGK
jgi:hypothetical protein